MRCILYLFSAITRHSTMRRTFPLPLLLLLVPAAPARASDLQAMHGMSTMGEGQSPNFSMGKGQLTGESASLAQDSEAFFGRHIGNAQCDGMAGLGIDAEGQFGEHA